MYDANGIGLQHTQPLPNCQADLTELLLNLNASHRPTFVQIAALSTNAVVLGTKSSFKVPVCIELR
jgi:hypothetical protein